ncbi:uncharacterized protein [Rutidosis leptorrhynchoides]|uniref:uncharacterized protein n=1 Tax=Rutidosis leptorrhynchoides TaxID=125765 RepID=UPI003A99F68F
MKTPSLNIRGFAVEGKFGWVRNLCVSERPDIAVFQETKCRFLSDWWVQSLWGKPDFGFIQKEVVGNSGGMLLIWDKGSFEAQDAFGNEFFQAIRGKWVHSGLESTIVDVYGLHNDADKIIMWESLSGLINNVDTAWLLCRDFNEVRVASDRLNSQFHAYRANRFNTFIRNNGLIEIPISGKRFTRISDDGVKLSKLDRFLVSDSFMKLWDDLSVIALDRRLSDHCPLILRDKIIDFGPKPFKIFDEWFSCEGIDNVINEAWSQPVTSTRRDCVFRDKLKNVKFALRSWSKYNYGKLDCEINELKKEAKEWELKAESNQLSNEDRVKWIECRRKWVEKEKSKSNMLKQKARIRWIIEDN